MFGLGITPILVTQLLKVVEWHWIFAMVSIPGLIVAYLLYRVLRNTTPTVAALHTSTHDASEHKWSDVFKYRNIPLNMLGMLAARLFGLLKRRCKVHAGKVRAFLEKVPPLPHHAGGMLDVLLFSWCAPSVLPVAPAFKGSCDIGLLFALVATGKRPHQAARGAGLTRIGAALNFCSACHTS